MGRLVFCLALTLVLTACGDDDDNTSSDSRDGGSGPGETPPEGGNSLNNGIGDPDRPHCWSEGGAPPSGSVTVGGETVEINRTVETTLAGQSNVF